MSHTEIVRMLRVLHAHASMHDLVNALAAVCWCEATAAYERNDEPTGEEYDRAADVLHDWNNLHV